jgi:hypothetical protein
MEVSDVARLKRVEAENARMHRIIARLTLKVDAMEDPKSAPLPYALRV